MISQQMTASSGDACSIVNHFVHGNIKKMRTSPSQQQRFAKRRVHHQFLPVKTHNQFPSINAKTKRDHPKQSIQAKMYAAQDHKLKYAILTKVIPHISRFYMFDKDDHHKDDQCQGSSLALPTIIIMHKLTKLWQAFNFKHFMQRLKIIHFANLIQTFRKRHFFNTLLSNEQEANKERNRKSKWKSVQLLRRILIRINLTHKRAAWIRIELNYKAASKHIQPFLFTFQIILDQFMERYSSNLKSSALKELKQFKSKRKGKTTN